MIHDPALSRETIARYTVKPAVVPTAMSKLEKHRLRSREGMATLRANRKAQGLDAYGKRPRDRRWTGLSAKALGRARYMADLRKLSRPKKKAASATPAR